MFLDKTPSDKGSVEVSLSSLCDCHVVFVCFLDETPSEEWPEKGEVEFEDVALRYDASLEPVIKHMGIKVDAGTRVSQLHSKPALMAVWSKAWLLTASCL